MAKETELAAVEVNMCVTRRGMVYDKSFWLTPEKAYKFAMRKLRRLKAWSGVSDETSSLTPAEPGVAYGSSATAEKGFMLTFVPVSLFHASAWCEVTGKNNFFDRANRDVRKEGELFLACMQRTSALRVSKEKLIIVPRQLEQ